MPKFNKPTPEKLNTIWAINSLGGDTVEPSVSKVEQGWVQEKPPYETENWINQQHDQYVAYINQLGIPEWDQYTEYQNGKSYVQGSNNVIYKCIQTHVNKNPATAGNEAFWERFEGNRQATTTTRGTVELATNNEVSQGSSTTRAVTPSGILSGLLGTGSLTEDGYFKIPINVSGSKREVIVAWCSNTGVVGSDSAQITASFPINIPKVLHLQLTHGVATDAEAAEMAYSVKDFTSNDATATFRRISGSNEGSETVRASFLIIGYD